jgi:ABC-type transport system involved in multi-copper enzyme maturation permease subunit
MSLFLSGIRKLVRRQASWLTLALLAGLLVLIMVAVGATSDRPGASQAERAAALSIITFPGAYDQILAFILGLGGLFAVIFGAAVAGSEWTWGTLKNAVARGQSRSRYTLVSFASVAFMIAIGLLLTFAIGVAAAVVGAKLAGIATDGITDSATLGRLPEQFARGLLAIVMEGAIGFTVATLARSQLAGIGAGIGLYFATTFAAIFLPDVVKYLPFSVATASVATGASSGGGFGGGGGGFRPAALDANTALLLVVVWLVGSLVVAAAFTERAEISG